MDPKSGAKKAMLAAEQLKKIAQKELVQIGSEGNDEPMALMAAFPEPVMALCEDDRKRQVREGMDSVICLLMVVTSSQRVRRGPHTNGRGPGLPPPPALPSAIQSKTNRAQRTLGGVCLQRVVNDNRERRPECDALSRGNCRRSHTQCDFYGTPARRGDTREKLRCQRPSRRS